MLPIKLLSNEVAFGQGVTIQVQLYSEDGVAIAPTSGKFTLYTPGGVVVIDDQIMTLNSTILEYALVTADLETQDLSYRIYIEYVYSGVTYTTNFLLDVVKTPLVLSVIENDLVPKEPNILNERWTGQTSYKDQINDAFEQVKTDIISKDRRPAMIIDASQISNLIILKTLETIFYSNSENTDDVHWQKYLKYLRQYENAFQNLTIMYDLDEDGVIDSTTNFGSIGLVR